MKAIRAHEWCGPRDLVIDEIDQPQPGQGQIVVRVNSAGLNFPDLLIITGKYQFKPALPKSGFGPVCAPPVTTPIALMRVSQNENTMSPGDTSRMFS